MHMIRLAALAVLALGVLAQGVSAQATPRVGYIDSRQIISQSSEAQQAQQAFDRDMARFRNEVQQMGEDLQTLVQQYEQQQLTLSPDAKQSREQEIRNKQGQYEERVRELEGQAATRQAELVEPIMERINDIIETMRVEGNYAMIFDVASQAIISADPSLDLTEEVIRRLESAAGSDGDGSP